MNTNLNILALCRLIKYIVAILFLGNICLLHAQINPMIHYTMEDGLPDKTVFTALNDNNGYMWFGTSAGVVRFDGESWEHFTSEDGLSDNDILKIFQDKNGRIWFLTFNGTFCYYYNGKFYNPNNSSILNLATINSGLSSVFEDSNETKWITPIDKDFFVSLNDFKVKHHYLRENITNIKGFIFELNKELVLLTNQFFFVLENGEFVIKKKDYPLPYNHRSYTISDGILYYLSKDGIIRLSSEGYDIVIPISAIPQLSNLSTLEVDSKGNIWLCTVNDGVYQFTNLDSTKIEYNQYLKNEVVASCIEDEYGNVWFATISNGVFMLPYNYSKKFSLTKDNGLSTNRIHTVTKNNDGAIWLGSENGIVFKYFNNEVVSIDLNKILKQKKLVYNHIVKIIILDDNVFVHTNNGIIHFKDDGIYNLQLITSSNGQTYSPKKMILDQMGRITVSHIHGISEIVKSNSNYRLESIKSIPLKRVFTHFVDSYGVLWYITKDGVFKYDEGKINEYSINGFDIQQRIKDITVLSDSTVVITTNGQGVIFCKNQKYKYRLTKKSGLSSDVLSSIYEQNDTIWITSSYGLDRINYDNGQVNGITNFKKNEGLPTNHVYDLYLDEDEIYVVSDYGLGVLKKEFMSQGLPAPHVYINKVMVNDSLYINNDFSIEKRNNDIKIDCSVINFNNKTLYQYRLLGLNDKWNTSLHKHFQFASLEPGKYIFEFRAKRSNSIWSQPASISFNVITPLLERPIFIVLYFIIIIIALSLVVIRRSNVNNANKVIALEQNYQIKSLEQKALQAMMNPHFIFNVLNSIQYYLSSDNSDKAQVNLTKFAKLIRKNLEINQAKSISIEEEIEYIELYLSLEKLRFEDSFKYHITVDSQVDVVDTHIPTMLIQPFIENAIWHGIMPQGGVGDIFISFKLRGNILKIEIFDNGVGYNVHKPIIKTTHKSVGLKMTKDRLKLMQSIYNDEFMFVIERIENKKDSLAGTKVTISLPNNIF